MSQPNEVHRDLPVPLTGEEIQSRGEQLAKNELEQMKSTERKKDINAKINKRLKRLRAAASKLAREIDDGEEVMEVVCRIVYWPSQSLAMIQRCDLDKGSIKSVVKVRDMEPDEHNLFEDASPDRAEQRLMRDWLKKNKKGDADSSDENQQVIEVPEKSDEEATDDELREAESEFEQEAEEGSPED